MAGWWSYSGAPDLALLILTVSCPDRNLDRRAAQPRGHDMHDFEGKKGRLLDEDGESPLIDDRPFAAGARNRLAACRTFQHQRLTRAWDLGGIFGQAVDHAARSFSLWRKRNDKIECGKA
jgi:hypothetical protein